MYIKSIVLDGFKSYGHRTEITGFDRQFTAITGLNGSGKSNILDSICFLLGITNLTHVRANNMLDLIFKSGQCGISKATVSITFDNTNKEQCPEGFENTPEITITRQIAVGGKNKYMINGLTVQNKKVQDLFCSVQLNVNNPHFLIMQGKITKVLNMKSHEILAMIEEAAGTKMYEAKRQNAEKMLQKKEAKLEELGVIVCQEVSPKLEKLRAERAKYMEYKHVERELEHMLRIFQAWEYFASQRRVQQARSALENEEQTIAQLHTAIEENTAKIQEIDEADSGSANKSAFSEELQTVTEQLKALEKQQIKMNSEIKAVHDDISQEQKQIEQLQKNNKDDEALLKMKQAALTKVQSIFEKLKEADARDALALETAQKHYEALNAGMELNEEGKAETLLGQLMNTRRQAMENNTLLQSASMQLDYCRGQLKEKQKQRVSTDGDLLKHKAALNTATQDCQRIEQELERLNFDEARMNELQTQKRQLAREIDQLQGRVEEFETQKPFAKFNYTDPEPNFNKHSVHGVVCRLIKVKKDMACIGIETAAGGKLFNVVIDSDNTGKKLLKHGQLQNRTTFIPINKIRGGKIDEKTIRYAEDLVGKENVQTAVSLLDYDAGRHQSVVEFIWGNVLICKNIAVAKQLAFDERIRRKCVTYDGDTVDPAGILSGGAVQKNVSLLLQLKEIKQLERQLQAKQAEMQQLNAELAKLSGQQNEYVRLRQQLEIARHDIEILTKRIQQSTHYRQQEEMDNLKEQIQKLEGDIAMAQKDEAKYAEKIADLESKTKTGVNREERLKQAEAEVKRLKAQADKSRKEWEKREMEYETFNLEIAELKKAMEGAVEAIANAEKTITTLEQKLESFNAETETLQAKITEMQTQVKKEKAIIAEKNKEMQKRLQKREQLEAQITKHQMDIKQRNHNLKKLQDDVKHVQSKQKDCEKRASKLDLSEGEKMSDADGHKLEKEIRKKQEMKNTLGRTVNSKAQMLFEQQEKEYNDLKKRENSIKADRDNILLVITDLDNKKKQVLERAYAQISKDFGSIFSTLLPGANAKLLPPTGQTILKGLEVKVSLGGVWKESLTELSGGQRSLAALSLILAMLLFKPAPLYILDEVDAALDLSHTQNIGNMLKTHFKKSQFIIVSLKDGMFNNANVLFRTQFVDGVSTVRRTVNHQD